VDRFILSLLAPFFSVPVPIDGRTGVLGLAIRKRKSAKKEYPVASKLNVCPF